MTEEEKIGRGIVEHTDAIAKLITRARELLAADRAEGPRAATRIAGYLARALPADGARLRDGKPHRRWWHLEAQPIAMTAPGALGAAASLVSLVLSALKKGPG